MVLPLLAPLLGSIFGPSLFTALGLSMPSAVAAGLGSGLASLAVTRDPQQALMSGLLTGGLGALSGGLGTGARAAGEASLKDAALKKTLMNSSNLGSAGQEGIKTALMDSGRLGSNALKGINTMVPGVSDEVVGYGVREGAKSAGANGGLGAITNWVREHPRMATAALALPALLPNKAPVPSEETKDIPEAFPSGPGPRSGYAKSMPMDSPEDYRTYGQVGGTQPTEHQFLPSGGLVTGPGGPTDDMVQAIGPGKTPIRLSNGEYVMPAAAVDAFGGPDKMDELRRRLLRARGMA